MIIETFFFLSTVFYVLIIVIKTTLDICCITQEVELPFEWLPPYQQVEPPPTYIS